MPRYDFKCENDHVTEVTCDMADVPSKGLPCVTCDLPATRMYHAPAVQFKGPGFYSTDVNGTLHRKRRRNAGDALPKEFDHGAARVADAI